MAGEASKEMGSILQHAMLAQKNLKTQCERLLELRRRLQQQLSPSDDHIAARLREFALDVEHMNLAFADGLHEISAMRMDYVVALKNIELGPDIFKAYLVGIKAGVRAIATCLDLAAKSGARLALNSNFAAMTEEELFDALVAQRLPERPTTETEAFSPGAEAGINLKGGAKYGGEDRTAPTLDILHNSFFPNLLVNSYLFAVSSLSH